VVAGDNFADVVLLAAASIQPVSSADALREVARMGVARLRASLPALHESAIREKVSVGSPVNYTPGTNICYRQLHRHDKQQQSSEDDDDEFVTDVGRGGAFGRSATNATSDRGF
jgi:hypothetical protein